MSMTINFYNQSSPTNKINKALGNSLGTCVINNIHDMNVVDPVFIIKTDALSGSLENLAKANYVVAGAPFNRSYFITGVDFSTAKTATVYCHCDVLSTYAGSLGTLNFTRGAGDINEMEDTSFPLIDRLKSSWYRFNGWNNNYFTNTDDGKRYLLRIADGRAKTYGAHIEVHPGDHLLYKNLLFEIGGSYNSAYIGDPTEIPMPPAEPYPSVADNTIFTISQEIGGQTFSQDYQFDVREQFGLPEPNYYIIAYND